MVKFSKELEAQLIPEWKEAFVNYWLLKKQIKEIKQSRGPKQPEDLEQLLDHDHELGRSIFDPVRSLVSETINFFHSDTRVDIIQVKSKKMEDGTEGEVYQTELLQLSSEKDEFVILNQFLKGKIGSISVEMVKGFFEKLDKELNKVNQFYRSKESEFMERGEILNKQLHILVDLKRLLHDRRRKHNPAHSWPSSPGRDSDYSETRSDSTEVQSDQGSELDEIIETLEKNGVSFINSATREKTKKGKPKMAVRIDIPATNPTRTITAVTSVLWEDLVNNPKKEGDHQVNRKKIQSAEKMIRSAFVELYRGLGFLKTYSSLNMLAFTKILKKFDKVANQQASTNYLRVVKRSHFISSDKVVRLMDEVESIFTKHFASDDRKRAMKFLRPQHRKGSHMVTFFVGLFTGCFVSLFTVYAILAHITGLFDANYSGYVETIYPVFSVFALLSLHMFMYGCNLFMWKGARINYNFIFEFQPSTALKHRDAFLMCTTLMTSVVAALVLHLLLRAHSFSPSHVDAIPGILIMVYMVLLVCPLNIFYRPTRYCFLRVMRNIICSPLYKVLMVDFFMADQLTSQIPLLRYMESTACYFLAGSLKTHEFGTCKSGRLYRELAYLISFLPYHFRAMQCARRWNDEGDSNHFANMGKYVSAMAAAGVRLTYSRDEDSVVLLVLVWLTSVIATLYQLYWDFVKDWGLFDLKSKNRLLRDNLILKHKSVYYVSIAVNIVLRITWVETVLGIRVGMVESRMLEFFLASLEVIRRGHWNFYRLENEHLNNSGKFRAVRTVPLPFHASDSD